MSTSCRKNAKGLLTLGIGIGFTDFAVESSAEVRRDLQQFWPAVTPELLDELAAVYPLSDFGASYIAGNNLFQSPAYTLITTLAAALGSNIRQNNTVYWQNQAIWGDYAIHCPSRYVASAAFNQSVKVPVWKLRFNAGYYAHGATLPYILNDLSSPLVFNTTLATVMKDWYLSFVISQDPNLPLPTRELSDRPWFPQYGAESTVIHVNESSISYIVDPDDSARCDLFFANARVFRN